MLDISLVVIGFIIVAISYFISEKIEKGQNSASLSDRSGQIHELWSEKDEEKVRSQVENVTAEKMNEIIDQTDEELSTISNEKIMAMDEFSNQLLEKIETNHKEVVFLYNMLNTKQDEIKKMVTEADKSKAALEDLMRLSQEKTQKSYTGIDMLQKIAKEGKEKVYEKLEKSELTADSELFDKVHAKKKPLKEPKTDFENEETMEIQTRLEDEIEESREVIPDTKKEKESDLKENVLNLYQEGKSILEISKLLHIGQGEVKLIIDLYQGVTI